MAKKYKLEKLKTEIKTLEGTPIAGFGTQTLLTYRKALISICEMYQPLQPGRGESLRAYDLGIRIMKAEETVELTEEEFQFLKRLVSESRVFVSVVIGRLRDYLNGIAQEKVEPQ